ncbi:MAG: hypothetical protein ACLQVX_19525 [Limisphaerales bacterium]
MNTRRALFGILTITVGLTVLSWGCGKVRLGQSNEYPGSVIRNNVKAFANGQPGFHWDDKTQKSDTNFALPDEAIYYDDYRLKDYDFKTKDNHAIHLGDDLTQFYWDVRFVEATTFTEGRDEELRFRFKARNKKTPAEIQKLDILGPLLQKLNSEITADTIDEQAKAALVKQFGQADVDAFIGKLRSDRKVVLATYSGATKEIAKSVAPKTTATGTKWGTAQEKALVGTYESVTPPYVLRLSFSGSVSMQNLESGDRNDGKWCIEDDTLATTWNKNGSKTTYEINSDGSFKSSHGILFVKTQR